MIALFFSFLVFVGIGFLNLASVLLLAIFLWWLYEILTVVTGKLKAYQGDQIFNKKQEIDNISNPSNNIKNEQSIIKNGFEDISTTMKKSDKENEKQDDSKN